MPLGEVRGRGRRKHATGVRRRDFRRTVGTIRPGRQREQESGSRAADECQVTRAKHFNSRAISAEVTAPMVEIRNNILDKSPCPA